MLIKFKAKISTIDRARALSEAYSKPIGVRTRVFVNTGDGVDVINSNQDLRFNINITPESNRVLLPTDFKKFKKDLQNNIIDKVNWKNVDLVSVGNEWLIWTTLEQLIDVVKTTKIVYDLLTPLGVKVANSGTPTPLLSGGTYNYYLATYGQAKADEFLSRWKPSLQFNTILALKVEQEWNMYIERGMDKLVNAFHFALRFDNVDCMKDIISYLRYYSKEHEVVNNETTVWDTSAPLLNRYLNILQGGGINYMVSYEDTEVVNGFSSSFTPSMEKVLCSFAE